jgi:hypothetical protein
MDVLEQFIRNISYKFPKGYPDLSDKADMALLENELSKLGINLKELSLTKHYKDRKKERSNIIDIPNLPPEMVGDKNLQEVKDLIISNTEQELLKRLARIETLKNIPISFQEIVVYRVLKPVLIFDNKKYDLNFTTESSKNDVKKLSTNSYYFVIIREDSLITLMGSGKDDLELEKQVIDHEKNEDRPIKPIKILTLSDFEYPTILDDSNQTPQNKINPLNLPYIVKKSYLPRSKFTHKDYGTGKIVSAASSDMGTGEPDRRGKVDWIEVDFGKEYVSGGQLKKTRTIKNLYTSSSPDLDMGETE